VKVSIIITTYNRPKALDRVLAGLAVQSVAPAEVIIADDGSGPETQACIDAWKTGAGITLLHAWQEDQGFRAAAARNRAVALASGDYLIFLDGDCIPFPDFVSGHAMLATRGRFVAGSRVLLDETVTRQIEIERSSPGSWSMMRWLKLRLAGHVNRLLPFIRLGDGSWRNGKPERWQDARTCNLGVWRDDFIAINGFDETYTGWGHEDADLAVRLIRHGCTHKTGRFAVPVIHLWHREAARAAAGQNLSRMDSARRGEPGIVGTQGVRQYLDAS
jgi:glycosyltransferase involved in cell wall biosynthesis